MSPPPLDPRLDRVVRLGRALSLATLVVVVLLVTSGLGIWLRPALVEQMVVPRLGLAGHQVALDGASLCAGLVISAVPLGILAYGLLQVRQIFRDFGRGELISQMLAHRLERFGAAVAVQGLISPFTSAALSVALTLGNPPGERALAVSLSSHDVVAVIVGLLIIGVGAVMREAARIAEENASFV
ncbi:DUF2975 domain-containing protein [Xanthobacter autotrophicus]|uniref:DUF2975 domain-containing protein n=1 Tax=Xanthobacter autotrophicus TaxID=280 RepID=UPI00372C3091